MKPKLERYNIVYDVLNSAGYTKAGVYGILGNMECESNVEACRKQGDFSASRIHSVNYVSDIRSGKISCHDFMYDKIGFGLCQWTFPTWKQELYNFGFNALDSEEFQAIFLVTQLSKWTEFSDLLYTLKYCDDIYTCTKAFLEMYEKPAVLNIDARYNAALAARDLIEGSTFELQNSYQIPDTITVVFGGREVKYHVSDA